MRPLWPIEKEILAIAAGEYPASAMAFREQIEAAQVVGYQNSGAGFFSDVMVPEGTLLLDEKSPLDVAYGNVAGIEHGMGFIIFLRDGRLAMIEGYSNAGEATAKIDFSQVAFELMPWERTQDTTRW